MLDANRAELDKCELIRFRAAIKAGVPAIMTAHVAVPRVAESADTPATLSHRLLTDILRHDLGFRGLVITDEFQMRAIQGNRRIGDVAVDAILAGADTIMVVWDKRDREEIYEALKAAYGGGHGPRPPSAVFLGRSVVRCLGAAISKVRGIGSRQLSGIRTPVCICAGGGWADVG